MTVEDYFPEIQLKKNNYNKYGIASLTLTKDNNILNGFNWRYTYYDEQSKKVKTISSYDLRRLRQNVEEQGLDWIVTDIELARETYKLNERLVSEHERIKEENKLNRGKIAEHTVSKCGVQYVYLNNHNPHDYWTYRDKVHPTITRKYLVDLRDIVTALGYEWIVKDKELYDSIIKREVEEMKVI